MVKTHFNCTKTLDIQMNNSIIPPPYSSIKIRSQVAASWYGHAKIPDSFKLDIKALFISLIAFQYLIKEMRLYQNFQPETKKLRTRLGRLLYLLFRKSVNR